MNGLCDAFNGLSVNSRRRNGQQKKKTITPPKKVCINRRLPFYMLDQDETNLWENMNLRKQTSRLVELDDCSYEFHSVADLFNKANKKFTIDYIERVQNPYLMFAYQLKKQQLEKRFGQVTERRLFHGTKEANVDSICENNFNWRYYGTSRGHLYGRGVSFSPKAYYAAFFCEKNVPDQVMFLCDVLVCRSCKGKADTRYPPSGFDSTHRPNGDVIVKYEDNEFYPAYLIHFHKGKSSAGCSNNNYVTNDGREDYYYEADYYYY